MDTDGDGLINGPELFKGVKKLIGQTLSPDQISMMIMAIDTNEDNRIGLRIAKSIVLNAICIKLLFDK